MRETLSNLIERADLRSAEVIEIAGLAVTITSAIVTREIGGAESLALFAFIFTVTSAARDIGVRFVQGVSDKIVERKQAPQFSSSGVKVRALH